MHCSRNLHRGARPGIELLAVQQADALLSELRRTLSELCRTLSELCRTVSELCRTLSDLYTAPSELRCTFTYLLTVLQAYQFRYLYYVCNTYLIIKSNLSLSLATFVKIFSYVPFTLVIALLMLRPSCHSPLSPIISFSGLTEAITQSLRA